jgi:hypothetical protein
MDGPIKMFFTQARARTPKEQNLQCQQYLNILYPKFKNGVTFLVINYVLLYCDSSSKHRPGQGLTGRIIYTLLPLLRILCGTSDCTSKNEKWLNPYLAQTDSCHSNTGCQFSC